jgi:hypothetical protein
MHLPSFAVLFEEDVLLDRKDYQRCRHVLRASDKDVCCHFQQRLDITVGFNLCGKLLLDVIPNTSGGGD